MNVTDLHKKLILAARNNPPSDQVPYAFEKRIMQNLRSLPKVDLWSLWSQGLWKATAPCFAVVVLLSVWTAFTPHHPAPQLHAADLESTVLAPLDGMGDTW